MKRILIQDTNGSLRKELRDFNVALTSQLRDQGDGSNRPHYSAPRDRRSDTARATVPST